MSNTDLTDSKEMEPYGRSFYMLNCCLEDIEMFDDQMKTVLRAILKNSNKRDHHLTLNSDQLDETLRKVKFAFNLTDKIANNVPNLSQKIFHYLIKVVRRAHRLVNEKIFDCENKLLSDIIEPLLHQSTIRKIFTYLSPKLQEFWTHLGASWNIPSEKWPNRLETNYMPSFIHSHNSESTLHSRTSRSSHELNISTAQNYITVDNGFTNNSNNPKTIIVKNHNHISKNGLKDKEKSYSRQNSSCHVCETKKYKLKSNTEPFMHRGRSADNEQYYLNTNKSSNPYPWSEVNKYTNEGHSVYYYKDLLSSRSKTSAFDRPIILFPLNPHKHNTIDLNRKQHYHHNDHDHHDYYDHDHHTTHNKYNSNSFFNRRSPSAPHIPHFPDLRYERKNNNYYKPFITLESKHNSRVISQNQLITIK